MMRDKEVYFKYIEKSLDMFLTRLFLEWPFLSLCLSLETVDLIAYSCFAILFNLRHLMYLCIYFIFLYLIVSVLGLRSCYGM